MDSRRDDRAHRSGRRRLWIAGILAGVLLVGGIAFNWVVLAYQPLSVGIYGGSSLNGRSIESFTGDDMWAFRYEEGAEFSYVFDFRNNGSRSVRITGFPESGDRYYTQRVAVELSGDDDLANERGGSPTTWQPFEPFTLHPGEWRYVQLTHRFRGDCDIEQPPANHNPAVFHGGTWWDRQRVDYEVLGIGRSTELRLHMAIGVEALGRCDVPADEVGVG